MSHPDLLEMIVNLPPITQLQWNSDTILDFIIEHENEADVNRFKDVDSIEKWLLADYTVPNVQVPVNVSENNLDDNSTRLKTILRPGTKITIPKPSGKKFNDIESLNAYLYKHNTVHPTNYDDSEELDVITLDQSPQWNQYGTNEAEPLTQKRSNLHRVLTEKQPTATGNTRANTNQKKNRTKLAADTTDESLFKCKSCERIFKHKSSLTRHEKIHLTKEMDGEPAKIKKTKHDTKKNVSGNVHKIPSSVPLNGAELIST